ncbi:hypothetical protein JTB14_022909 [Gonioctena quinquepunctata]|nr:hypothetical protein JTB14_022909 [Gonioctena quinquepunctata]
MTENQIIQILLKEGRNSTNYFDYPKVQKEAVNIIAKNITDIIYESLKLKSSSSNSKRRDILKFLNSICEVREQHTNPTEFGKYLIGEQKTIKCTKSAEVEELIGNCKNELENQNHTSMCANVLKYYEKKNAMQKRKFKCIEFIKERDQVKMDSKYNIHILDGYREKQIKYAYALLNMDIEVDSILEEILNRLSSYEELERYEQTFLQYMFAMGGIFSENVMKLLKPFFFVVEEIVLAFALELLNKENELDVCQYFVDLEGNERFLRLRNLCRSDDVIYLKLKTLIYELYCMSYCNKNILKLCDFII